jgi:hypothetical protein
MRCGKLAIWNVTAIKLANRYAKRIELTIFPTATVNCLNVTIAAMEVGDAEQTGLKL